MSWLPRVFNVVVSGCVARAEMAVQNYSRKTVLPMRLLIRAFVGRLYYIKSELIIGQNWRLKGEA